MITCLLVCLLASSKGLTLKTVKTYEEVPGAQDLFLQGPGDLCLDSSGRLHVFDFIGRTIFVYDKDGKYLGHYGKSGEGPGELTVFSRAGGPQAQVTALGDTLYVYDGGARRLNLFNQDLSFREAKPFNVEAGRVQNFRPISGGRMVVFYSSYFSEVPFKKVAIYNQDKTDELELFKVKDETWKSGGDASSRHVELIAFAPQMYMTVNHLSETIVVGDSHEPAFSIFGFDGKLKSRVVTKLSQQEVTAELKTEYNDQKWIKNNTFFTTSFPEKRGFYEDILAIGKDRFLLFLKSPLKANIEGYLVDSSGANLGRFTFSCGEGGALYASWGRLFGCIVNEDGEFQVVELSVEAGTGQDTQGG